MGILKFLKDKIYEDNIINVFVVFLSFLVLFNYVFWWFFGGNLSIIFIYLILTTILIIFISTIFLPKLISPAIVFFLLMCVSLGSPTEAWDARSIWLFHSKRIYLDGNLFAQLDNYADWSHNDYPVLIPSLSASMARFVGYWNESYPKSGTLIGLLAPILYIANYLGTKIKFFLFILACYFFMGEYLINGYMDALISFYAIALLICIDLLWNQPGQDGGNSRFMNLLVFIFFSSSIVLIKNEGIFLLATIMISFILTRLLFHKEGLNKIVTILLLIIPAFILFISWKAQCINAEIKSDMMNGGAFFRLFYNIFNFDLIYVILFFVPNSVWFLIVGAVIIFLNSTKNIDCERSDIFNCGSVFIILYLLFLIVTYLSTPHDIVWHLKTSIDRTTMPIGIFLIYYIVSKMFSNREIEVD